MPPVSLRLECSALRQTRAHHQINVATIGVAPLPEFFGQGLVSLGLIALGQQRQPLMHQIQGVVDQLSGLFGGHGIGSNISPS